MAAALLITLLALGGVGVYLAMPGSRLHAGKAALLVLLGAGAALVGLTVTWIAGPASRFWFVVLAVVGLWGAVRVVTHMRPVYSALYFILVAISTAGLLLTMHAEFMAFALVIVYGGAILVTYMFVIMLAQQEGEAWYDRHAREPLLGIAAGFVVLAAITARLLAPDAPTGPSGTPLPEELVGNVVTVGTRLLTEYIVAVQLAGILLLAAMVGAIAIARRKADPANFQESD